MQQLLNYQKEVYARQTKYSPIVPVVFYHGKQKWNIRTSFAQLESEDLLPYTLNFSYILINLQEVDLTKIKLSLTSLAILHIFSQIWEVGKVEKLDQYIRFIEDVILRDSNDKLFKLILMYIYRVHNTEPKQAKIESAKNLQNMGFNIDTIMNAVGLSKSELRKHGIT